MTDHDDSLAGIDLHVWRVPPPFPVDGATLVGRALSPAAVPARRRRTAWMMAAFVLLNAAIATLIAVLLARPSSTEVVIAPAGGGSVDVRVTDLLERLERERADLERKIAEIDELRALIKELQDKVRRYEQSDRDRTVPKRAAPEPQPIDPFQPRPSPSDSCDEVSCVLRNYDGACCVKFRSPRPPAKVSSPALPDGLERAGIVSGIGSVKAKVFACGDHSQAKGQVKIRVRVEPDGHVSSVIVETTPDAALGNCVAAVVQQAVFPRTRSGGMFGYPFLF